VPARVQAEASLLAAYYRRLRREGFLPSDALICAFRHLLATAPGCTLSLDEAFFLVCKLDGLWAVRERSLDLLRCVHCQRPRLVALGSSAPDTCRVCQTDWTPRAPPPRPRHSATPVAAPVSAPAVESELARASLMRLLQDLGAGKRVKAVLFADPCTAKYRAPVHKRTVTAAFLGRPLRVDRWSNALSTPEQVRYSVFGATYLRLQRLGLERTQAMALAVGRTRDSCRAICPPAPFDRCFEVAALIEGAWGVAHAALVLTECTRCGSQFLASTTEQNGAPDCPFCALSRRHRSGFGGRWVVAV
jgi:hypothetical protein